ncbi:unnamed protein product [Acanthoscelides obtectus]|uniref:Uncharacterized protein n=1 Tax=Acanthoscelides obtectus TaxID=200917 RepID=A0A9P0JNT5_ACAOB|nr:unnamed protein product [Acanthoscelides obtectus]CAK1673655.1 hypothetical protein AOBTE_LOCUS29406 [Acanthoscelides obtectus]
MLIYFVITLYTFKSVFLLLININALATNQEK